MKASKVADEEALKLGKEQGEAFQRAIDYMIHTCARGAETASGEYKIVYTVEPAEGMYHLIGESLVWHNPDFGNVHIGIIVCDAEDGRFIPGLTVYVTLIDPEGHILGDHMHTFMWHPWLYHYGLNWKVPQEGDYTMQVRVLPPDFMRHDKVNGYRYTEPAEVEFTNIHITPGKQNE